MNTRFGSGHLTGKPVDQGRRVFATEEPCHGSLTGELVAKDLAHDREPGFRARSERLRASHCRPVRAWRSGGEQDLAVKIKLSKRNPGLLQPHEGGKGNEAVRP